MTTMLVWIINVIRQSHKFPATIIPIVPDGARRQDKRLPRDRFAIWLKIWHYSSIWPLETHDRISNKKATVQLELVNLFQAQST